MLGIQCIAWLAVATSTSREHAGLSEAAWSGHCTQYTCQPTAHLKAQRALNDRELPLNYGRCFGARATTQTVETIRSGTG